MCRQDNRKQAYAHPIENKPMPIENKPMPIHILLRARGERRALPLLLFALLLLLSLSPQPLVAASVPLLQRCLPLSS
jgi:hypothetical protein